MTTYTAHFQLVRAPECTYTHTETDLKALADFILGALNSREAICTHISQETAE